VVPNGQIISDVLLTANNGDIVSVVSGTYPSEYAFTITKNITIMYPLPSRTEQFRFLFALFIYFISAPFFLPLGAASRVRPRSASRRRRRSG
jgi:hypothetical protein